MVAETPDMIPRRPVQLPGPLYSRIARIANRMRADTGRAVSLPEVIERALDRAAMEEDTP